jgi:hypothetical protein
MDELRAWAGTNGGRQWYRIRWQDREGDLPAECDAVVTATNPAAAVVEAVSTLRRRAPGIADNLTARPVAW